MMDFAKLLYVQQPAVRPLKEKEKIVILKPDGTTEDFSEVIQKNYAAYLVVQARNLNKVFTVGTGALIFFSVLASFFIKEVTLLLMILSLMMCLITYALNDREIKRLRTKYAL